MNIPIPQTTSGWNVANKASPGWNNNSGHRDNRGWHQSNRGNSRGHNQRTPSFPYDKFRRPSEGQRNDRDAHASGTSGHQYIGNRKFN